MNIKCPHCGTEYEVEDESVGRRAQCDVCGNKFVIGATGADEPQHIDSESKDDALPPSKPNYNPNTINCPDCGHIVSRRAAQCPQCGCPINPPQVNRQGGGGRAGMSEFERFMMDKARYELRQQQTQSDKSRVAYILLAFFLFWLGIHDFYAGRIGSGILHLLVLNLLLNFPLILIGFPLGTILSAIMALIEICAVTKDGKGKTLS